MTRGERARTDRTCVRCGRSGLNAFEPLAGSGGWVCTHSEPCAGRRRSRWRAGRRAGLGRPRSSPLLAWSDEGQTSCIIGADPETAAMIEHVIQETTPLEVERLDLSPRSLVRLSRGTYSVVVVDSCPSDPLAYCNEVYRRLSGANRSQLPIVICSPRDAPLRPPLAKLALRPNVRVVVSRPVRDDELVAAVSEALGWSGVESGLSA